MTLTTGTHKPFRALAVALGHCDVAPPDSEPGACHGCSRHVRRDAPFCDRCLGHLPYALRDRVVPLFSLSVRDPGSFRQRHRLNMLLDEGRRIAERHLR